VEKHSGARSDLNSLLHGNVSLSPSPAMCLPCMSSALSLSCRELLMGWDLFFSSLLPFQAGHGHPRKSARMLTARLQLAGAQGTLSDIPSVSALCKTAVDLRGGVSFYKLNKNLKKKEKEKEKAAQRDGERNRKGSGTITFCTEATASAGCVPGETGFPGSERSRQRAAKNEPANLTICLWIECHTCFISTQCLVSEEPFIYFRTC